MLLLVMAVNESEQLWAATLPGPKAELPSGHPAAGTKAGQSRRSWREQGRAPTFSLKDMAERAGKGVMEEGAI